MTRNQLWAWLRKERACEEAWGWLLSNQFHPKDAWRQCPEGAWLLWALGRRALGPVRAQRVSLKALQQRILAGILARRAIMACLEATHEELKRTPYQITPFYMEVLHRLRTLETARIPHDAEQSVRALYSLIPSEPGREGDVLHALRTALRGSFDLSNAEQAVPMLGVALRAYDRQVSPTFFADAIRRAIPWEAVEKIL